jgi:serine protease Do
MARHVMNELRDGGRVRRAQLGVTVQPVTSEIAESLKLGQVTGAIVSSVASGSAAERAGVMRGDVIRTFNGQPVHDTNALRNRVAASAPGSTATLVIVRDGTERSLTVTLDEAAASARQATGRAGAAADSATLGVAVAALTPESAARAGLPRDLRGLLIQNVNPDSRAASAGLQPGDVIVEVNQAPVTTIDELRAAVTGGAGRPLLLLINRDGRATFVTVRPGEGSGN